jgi:hypothetical protein
MVVVLNHRRKMSIQALIYYASNNSTFVRCLRKIVFTDFLSSTVTSSIHAAINLHQFLAFNLVVNNHRRWKRIFCKKRILASHDDASHLMKAGLTLNMDPIGTPTLCGLGPE